MIKILGLEGVKEALKREIKTILMEINLCGCVSHLVEIFYPNRIEFLGIQLRGL